MNGGNKIAMEIRLVGESILCLKLLYVDDRFLSKVGDDNESYQSLSYFQSDDMDFCMYSYGKGSIIDTEQYALVLPDKHNMVPGMDIKHRFESDKKRREFLTSMFFHIKEWADRWSGFSNDTVVEHPLVVNDRFWVY